jgi:hypothetical protein
LTAEHVVKSILENNEKKAARTERIISESIGRQERRIRERLEVRSRQKSTYEK